METKKITAAAIFNLQHTQIKLWFTEKPSRTDELDEWLLQGVFYQFKDDLQAGKFMWLATSIFRKQASTSSFYDEITKIGVFIPDDMLRLIGIENDKVYLNAIPIKESDPEPNKNHIEESIKPGSSGTFCAEKLKPHSKINYLVVYYLSVALTISLMLVTYKNYGWSDLLFMSLGILVGYFWSKSEKSK